MSAQFQVQLFTTELNIISIPPESYTFFFHGITKLILQSWEDDYLNPPSASSQEYRESSMPLSPSSPQPVSSSSFSAHNRHSYHNKQNHIHEHFNSSIDPSNSNATVTPSQHQSSFSSVTTSPIHIPPDFNSNEDYTNLDSSINSDLTSTLSTRKNTHVDSIQNRSSGYHDFPTASSRAAPHQNSPYINRLTLKTNNTSHPNNPQYRDSEYSANKFHNSRTYRDLLDHVSRLKQFVNVSFTPVECSVICPTELVENLFGQALTTHPATILKETYLAIQIDIAGSNTGPTLLEITAPISNAKIPIFFIPTHLSDFVLIPSYAKDKVTKALKARGFEFSNIEEHYDDSNSERDEQDTEDEDEDKGYEDDNGNSHKNTTNTNSPAHNKSPSIFAYNNSPFMNSTTSGISTNESSSPILEGASLTPYLSQLGNDTIEKFQSFDVKHVIKIDTQLLLTGLRRSNNKNKSTLRNSHRNKATATGPSSSSTMGPSLKFSSKTSSADKDSNNIFLKIVQALIHPPDFFSVTIVNDQEVSFIINRETAEMFDKDQLKGSTEDVVIPISFDLSQLPENSTGIVAGVAFQLYSFDLEQLPGSNVNTMLDKHNKNSPSFRQRPDSIIENEEEDYGSDRHDYGNEDDDYFDSFESQSRTSRLSSSSHLGEQDSPRMQISYLSTAKSGVLLVSKCDIPLAAGALTVFRNHRESTKQDTHEAQKSGYTRPSRRQNRANDSNTNNDDDNTNDSLESSLKSWSFASPSLSAVGKRSSPSEVSQGLRHPKSPSTQNSPNKSLIGHDHYFNNPFGINRSSHNNSPYLPSIPSNFPVSRRISCDYDAEESSHDTKYLSHNYTKSSATSSIHSLSCPSPSSKQFGHHLHRNPKTNISQYQNADDQSEASFKTEQEQKADELRETLRQRSHTDNKKNTSHRRSRHHSKANSNNPNVNPLGSSSLGKHRKTHSSSSNSKNQY